MNVVECKHKHEKSLFKKKNVVSVGVGYKVRQGVLTREQCVIVGVTTKVAAGFLSKRDLVPSTLDGVSTDVVETGVISAYRRTDRNRPVPGGVSIAHEKVTAGTVGCLVRDRNPSGQGARYILSNNHVLANSNNANVGDVILQPGPADGGTQDDVVAELTDWAPISFGGNAPPTCPFLRLLAGAVNAILGMLGCTNRLQAVTAFGEENLVDAALAFPLDDSLVTPEILDLGVPSGAAVAGLGDRVQKSGRTTGVTRGVITQVDATVQVQYGGGRIATFVNQTISDIGSAGGDSGSAILDLDLRVVGLLFAGGTGITIFNPIDSVLDILKVDIVTNHN